MPTTAATALPEQGQLVEVRRRRFVVTEVQRSSLPPDPLQPGQSEPQHVVRLSSVEDEGLGEELAVVWELEPGAQVHDKTMLPAPTGLDEPRKLEAFLDAVAWGAVSSADVRALQAPFRSGIEIEDYQLDPVVRAIQMPRANLLIADDVGLGKTIETGLVVQELILRHRVRTVLVVCPASIQIQWRDQMRDKFGLEFRIVDSNTMKELRRSRGLHVNPWTHFPRLITSIDFLKRDRPLRLLREVLPPEGKSVYPRPFDLLIVDEAHNVAPSGRGKYATDSQRTDAVRTLVPHFEHKLFLSATPHNGYPESFTALLELLDNQRFARCVPPDREQLGAVMVRRLKRELPPRWDGKPRFPARKLQPLFVDYPDAERRAHHLLSEYTQLRQANAQDAAERFAAEFVLKLLKKRLFSSPEAFATTLLRHQRSALGIAKDRNHPRPTVGLLQRQFDAIEEDFADDAVYEEATEEVIEAASRSQRGLGANEQQILNELTQWAETARGRVDAKAQALIRYLHDTIKPGGKWSHHRIIIFTEYRATQNWLLGRLATEGLAEGERIMMLYGGMASDDRERIKAAFQADPVESEVRILLATDAASEGIDLQNHCYRLIHYEIPWNPSRMEQRNGRVDRHGQDATEVLIYHFIGRSNPNARVALPKAGTAPGDLEDDMEFLFRAAQKVEAIREDLGNVGLVLAVQIEEAMLGKRRQLDTAAAERAAEPARKMLRIERKLREQIDKLHQQLNQTRDQLHLSPENIQAVVTIGLELAGQPPLREAKLKDVWPDPTGKRTRCPVFHLPAMRGSWARCSEGLAHPHSGVIRPIVFDQALTVKRDDVVLAHLNHRLVQMSLGVLRAETFAAADDSGQRRLHRFTARTVHNQSLRNPAILLHGRLLMLGSDNRRLHEEILVAGSQLKEGRLARLTANELKDALDAATLHAPAEAVGKRLLEVFPAHAGALLQTLHARMEERAKALSKVLTERADKEVRDTELLLTELQRSILDELAEPETQQLDLFSPVEKDQLQRNRDSLRERAELIPAEIVAETAAIRARFADPQPRLFPLAVTFLVPERMAQSGGLS